MDIKYLRAKTGMSRAKFYEAFGVPERTLEDWENGKRTPPAYVVNLLEMAVENFINKKRKTYFKQSNKTNSGKP